MPIKKDPKKKNSKVQDTRAKKKKIIISSMEVETPSSGGEGGSGERNPSGDGGTPNP